MEKSSDNTSQAYLAIAALIKTRGFAVGDEIRIAYIESGCAPTSANNFAYESQAHFPQVTGMDISIAHDHTGEKIVFPAGLSEEEASIRIHTASDMIQQRRNLVRQQRRHKIS